MFIKIGFKEVWVLKGLLIYLFWALIKTNKIKNDFNNNNNNKKMIFHGDENVHWN